MNQDNKFLFCTLCSESLTNESVLYCPQCGRPYHKRCWKKAGNACKIYKCTGSTLFRWYKIETLIAKTIEPSTRPSNKCNNQNCTNHLKETSPFYIYCVKCGEEINSPDKQKKVFVYPFFEFIARHSVIFVVSLLFLLIYFSSAKINLIKQNQIYGTQTAVAFQLTAFKTHTPTNTARPTNTITPSNTIRPTNTPKPTNTTRPTATRIPFKPYTAIKDCARARVMIGDIVVVEDGINNLFIRSSSDNHPSSNIIGYLKPGQRAEIISGPECSWNWIMWRIRRLDDNFEGWVAESDGSDFWLQLDK